MRRASKDFRFGGLDRRSMVDRPGNYRKGGFQQRSTRSVRSKIS